MIVLMVKAGQIDKGKLHAEKVAVKGKDPPVPVYSVEGTTEVTRGQDSQNKQLGSSKGHAQAVCRPAAGGP